MIVISNQNFVGYSIAIQNTRSERVYEIYVAHISDPNCSFKICEIFGEVCALEWNASGGQLLIAENNNGGRLDSLYKITTWEPAVANLFLGKWKCTHFLKNNIHTKAQKSLESFKDNRGLKSDLEKCIYAGWFRCDKLIISDFSKIDETLIQNKFSFLASTSSLICHGVPQEGYLCLTTNGQIYLCVIDPSVEGKNKTGDTCEYTNFVQANLFLEMFQLKDFDTTFEFADLINKDDGSCVIALSAKAMNSAIIIYEISFSWLQGNWKLNASRLNGFFPFQPYALNTSHSMGQQQSIAMPVNSKSTQSQSINNVDHIKGYKTGLKFARPCSPEFIFVVGANPSQCTSVIELWRYHEISSKILEGFPLDKFVPRKKKVWTRLNVYETQKSWMLYSSLVPLVPNDVTIYQCEKIKSNNGSNQNNVNPNQGNATSPNGTNIKLAWVEYKVVSSWPNIKNAAEENQQLQASPTSLLKLSEWPTNLPETPPSNASSLNNTTLTFGKSLLGTKPPQYLPVKIIQTTNLNDPLAKDPRPVESSTAKNGETVDLKRKRVDWGEIPIIFTRGLACSVHRTCVVLTPSYEYRNEKNVINTAKNISIYPIGDAFYSSVCKGKVKRGAHLYTKVMTQLLQSSLLTNYDFADIVVNVLHQQKPLPEAHQNQEFDKNGKLHGDQSITNSFVSILKAYMDDYEMQPPLLKRSMRCNYFTSISLLTSSFRSYHKAIASDSSNTTSKFASVDYHLEMLSLGSKLKLFVLRVNKMLSNILTPLDFTPLDCSKSIAKFLMVNGLDCDLDRLLSKAKGDACVDGIFWFYGLGKTTEPSGGTYAPPNDIRSARCLFQWITDVAYQTLLCTALLLFSFKSNNDMALKPQKWQVKMMSTIKGVLSPSQEDSPNGSWFLKSLRELLYAVKRCCTIEPTAAPLYFASPSIQNKAAKKDTLVCLFHYITKLEIAVKQCLTTASPATFHPTEQKHESSERDANLDFTNNLANAIGIETLDELCQFLQENYPDPINLTMKILSSNNAFNAMDDFPFSLSAVICNEGDKLDALTYQYLPSIASSRHEHSSLARCTMCSSFTNSLHHNPSSKSSEKDGLNIIKSLWLPEFRGRCLCGGYWKSYN